MSKGRFGEYGGQYIPCLLYTSYISSEYQKMVDSNKLYSSTLLEIPAPHFVVFYNGTTKQEDSWYNYCLLYTSRCV